MIDDDEERHWLLLGARRVSVRVSVAFTLFHTTEERQLLNMSTAPHETRDILWPAIFLRIQEMPSQIQTLILQDPEGFLGSLCIIARLRKRNLFRLWDYHDNTATGMLHQEKINLVTPVNRKSKGISLSPDF